MIETTGSRTRLNIIGALPLQNIGSTVTEMYDTINSESIVRFFWKLKKEHYPLEQKVHLVLDGAYDTRNGHDAIRIKRAVPLIPPREGSAFWEQGHPRNLAVGCQKLYGSNKKWKKRYGYHKRSLSETAMYRVKQLLGGKLSLRNYNAQVGKTYAMIKALNKLTGLGMRETRYVV